MPYADEDGLAVVAEGIARILPSCSIDVGENVLHPTASIGYTLIEPRSAGVKQVLVDAERALQHAKRSIV